MSQSRSSQGRLALSVLLSWSLAMPPGAAAAPPGPGTATASPSALVKRPAAQKPKTYAALPATKAFERSKGAVAERDWTVMYYLDADCNLEAPMMDDVDELEVIGSTDNVNVLTLLDRTPQHDRRDGNWSHSRLLLVTRDGQMGKIRSKILHDLREMDTADPRTLVEFVAFSIQNFPAKHYALVLGNHGGTWMGMLNDDTDNEEGMRLAPFVEALAALKAAGAPKLDLIVFDMCLMAQVEVMDAIAPYASYGVASEELEPGTGYPNHRVLHALASNPKMSPREFAQSMVREWHASYAEVGEATVTSSATDLAKVPDLVAAVDALAAALAQAPGPVLRAAARARAATHFYGGEQGGGGLASFDLGEFVALLARQDDAAPIRPQLEAVAAAVRAAVVEHAEGEAHRGSTGLAIYFPANRKVHPDYKSLPFARGSWDEFLKRGLTATGGSGGGSSTAGSSGSSTANNSGSTSAGSVGSPSTGSVGSSSTGSAASAPGVQIVSPDPAGMHPLGEGLTVRGTVSGSPTAIRASIGFRDPDGSITTISDEEVQSPGVTPLADGSALPVWHPGQSFTYQVRPRVRAVSDGKASRLVPLTPLSPGSRYARADASYNSLMGDLQVSTIFDTKTGKLETIFCLNEKGARVPTAVHPVKGERLVFYQTVAGDDGKAPRLRPVPALVSSGRTAGAKPGGGAADKSGLKLIDSALPVGDYVLTLTAYDAGGSPAGTARLRLRAGGGAGVAPGVAYPDYGLPSVSWDDVEYVDLTAIIPPAEYGQFEATWSDYDFMVVAESDDLSTQDLAYLSEVALTAEELQFDQADWSDEYEDDALDESTPAEDVDEDSADEAGDDGESADADDDADDDADAVSYTHLTLPTKRIV